MNDLNSLIEGIASQLGRAFLLVGLLPMFILVAVNQYVLFGPAATGAAAPWNFFPEVTEPFLGLLPATWLTTLLLATLLTLLVLPLNLFILRLFEGLVPSPGMMKALMLPATISHLRQYRKHYGPITEARAQRRALMDDIEYDEDPDYDSYLERTSMLEAELDRLHLEKEKEELIQTLPYDQQRVLPTSFGNAWAVIEDYPVARYGMDGTLFWPYMRTILIERNPGLLDLIDNQKLLVDMSITLALVAGILLLESVVLALLRLDLILALLAVVCLLLFAGFYGAGVSYVRAMGALVSQSFDLYRLFVLDAFGLSRPASLDEEYFVWTRLGAFVRRGEPFYFDQLDRQGDADL